MAGVMFRNVHKQFENKEVLRDINLKINDGELIVVVGPSGCGKTTLLRTLAGFEKIDKGDISINSNIVSGSKFLPPEKRNIAMVFQSYALWPHFSVFENVAYPLKIKKMSKKEIFQKVEEILELTKLTEFAKKKPEALSGGQRQRVALARCLVANPDVMLLDEPLANLDVHLKEKMVSEFRMIKKNIKTTMMYVTHDQVEALMLADKIVVMNEGKIQQIDTPENVYGKPANEFVAKFIGEGNILPVEIEDTQKVRYKKHVFDAKERKKNPKGLLCFKPEDVEVHDTGIEARVKDVFYLGMYNKIVLDIDGFEIIFKDYGFNKLSERINIRIKKSYLI